MKWNGMRDGRSWLARGSGQVSMGRTLLIRRAIMLAMRNANDESSQPDYCSRSDSKVSGGMRQSRAALRNACLSPWARKTFYE